MHTPVKTWLGVIIIIIIALTAVIFIWYQQKIVNFDGSLNFNYQLPKRESRIANPASVFCEQNGGVLEIRTSEDGGQAGYCLFPDGSECEEWAYYRGECKKYKVDTSDWQTYRSEKYGFEMTFTNDWQGNMVIVCETKDENPLAYVQIFLPTTDSNWSDGACSPDNKIDGFATCFTISVFDTQGWNKEKKELAERSIDLA